VAFSSVIVVDVIDAVHQIPDKTLATDLMPTSVLKQVIQLVATYFTELFICLLTAGHFQSGYKEAFITPIVKKAILDTTDVSLYRPISICQLYQRLHRYSPTDGLFMVSDWVIKQKPPSSKSCRSSCKPLIALNWVH